MRLASPYRIDAAGRTASVRDESRAARDLIEAVLLTAPGERVMRPDFGAGLQALLFEPNSEALETAAELLIRAAIQRHLSEILTLSHLALRREEGLFEISLSYVLRATGEVETHRITQEAPS